MPFSHQLHGTFHRNSSVYYLYFQYTEEYLTSKEQWEDLKKSKDYF